MNILYPFLLIWLLEFWLNTDPGYNVPLLILCGFLSCRPLPKNLHLPIGNERFHSIQCRMALSSLNSLLRQMNSFVLLENHSYIKFIEG